MSQHNQNYPRQHESSQHDRGQRRTGQHDYGQQSRNESNQSGNENWDAASNQGYGGYDQGQRGYGGQDAGQEHARGYEGGGSAYGQEEGEAEYGGHSGYGQQTSYGNQQRYQQRAQGGNQGGYGPQSSDEAGYNRQGGYGQQNYQQGQQTAGYRQGQRSQRGGYTGYNDAARGQGFGQGGRDYWEDSVYENTGRGERYEDEDYDTGYRGEQGRQGMPLDEGRIETRPASRSGKYSGVGPKGYKRSDERLTEEINEALTQHGELDASEIEVKVSDGAVTLSGSVNTRQCKRTAEDIVESISGVQDVQNQLRVKQRGQQSGSQSESSKSSEAGHSRAATVTGSESKTSSALRQTP